MTVDQALFDAAASRGAKFLDQKVPGWAARIDVVRLNMVNAERCILGQFSQAIAEAEKVL